MLIKKIILHGYKRFSLNNINHFEWTIGSTINIVLGANGSGKSQLLKQLNPLPIDKNDFTEDGYKYVEIVANNNEYTISSNYVAKGKHSFILNNIEMNAGGTKKVQSELVYEHFKLTNNIMEILLNQNRICIMSPAERKHWFTELSHIDYTFAIAMYNKLKQRHRDILGSIELLQEEIIKTKTLVIIDDETILQYKEEITILEQLISHIISLYDHTDITYIDVISKIDTISKELNKVYNNDMVLSNINIDEAITETTIKLNMVNNQIKDTYNKIAQLEQTITTSKQHTILEADKQRIINEITNNNIVNTLNINLDISEQIYKDLTIAHSELYSLLGMLSEYTDVPYSITIYKETIDELNNITSDHNKTISNIDALTIRKTMLESLLHDNNKVTCDKCANTWYLNYDKAEHDRLINELSINNQKLVAITTKKIKIEESIAKLDSKKAVLEQIKSFMFNSTTLTPIWKYILTKYDIANSNVSELYGCLESIYVELTHLSERNLLEIELSKINKSLEELTIITNVKNDIINGNITELDLLLKEYVTNKAVLENMLVKYNKEKEYINKLTNLFNTLKSSYKDIDKNITNEIKVARNKTLTELTTNLKSILIDTTQKLTGNQSYIDIITNNTKKIEEYTNIAKLLNLTIKELSPSEGLIAKSMNSFLNIFITEMNNVINAVWSYPVEILPCEVTEENDLDYKFKVKIDNNEVIEDVSKLSSSTQEIVDLSFRIVFAKYMGIGDMPLYLDELGRTMDDTHRINMFDTIDNIFSSNFVQIFIVSHFESMYGRFYNSDIIVLDTRNLILSSNLKYNKNLIIG